jgi:hypothetical protein
MYVFLARMGACFTTKENGNLLHNKGEWELASQQRRMETCFTTKENGNLLHNKGEGPGTKRLDLLSFFLFLHNSRVTFNRDLQSGKVGHNRMPRIPLDPPPTRDTVYRIKTGYADTLSIVSVLPGSG